MIVIITGASRRLIPRIVAAIRPAVIRHPRRSSTKTPLAAFHRQAPGIPYRRRAAARRLTAITLPRMRGLPDVRMIHSRGIMRRITKTVINSVSEKLRGLRKTTPDRQS